MKGKKINKNTSNLPSLTPRGGLVPYDSLSTYLKEIKKIPRISPEEEYQLALRYYNNKDIEAAYTLVKANLWLVVKIAKKYETAAKNILDLIQEGNIGLMEAAKNFNPYKGIRFPSYASWWIKAYIIRYIMANMRMVKIGTTQAQRKLFFNLKKEKEKLEKQGIYPTTKLLAQRLNVKESEVIEMDQRLNSTDISTDTPIGEDKEQDLYSLLPSNVETAEELVSNKEKEKLIYKAIEEFKNTISPREIEILNRRLLAEEKDTLQVLSERLHLSKERVRQLEGVVKEKLKKFLLNNYGNEVVSSLL